MIEQRNSFFPIVIFDKDDSWEALQALAPLHLDKDGLKRLRMVLEAQCKCVVVERHYIDKDYRDTFSHYHSKKFNTSDSRCVRLHFFSCPVTESDVAGGEEDFSLRYLGYSVMRPTRPNCMGRTLLTHKLRLNGGAHLVMCRERVHLFGNELQVEGFPFISQDEDATVCAQSALWMVLRYFSNRYSRYSEIHPFQITNLANQVASGTRIYPSSGMYSWQLAEALRLQKFSPMVYSRSHGVKFDHLLYTYIESGLPVLVTMKNHVVVAYGHVSDYTHPYPSSQDPYIFSSHYNHSYVVSDDNKFPYQLLKRSGPGATGEGINSKFSWESIEEFIVPLPEKVFLSAEYAEDAIVKFLDHPTTGIQASPSLRTEKLVLRLFLTSSQSFKRSLHKRGMGHKVVEETYRRLPMPYFIWVCEIAEADEFINSKKILGEIIWDPTRNVRESDGWIARHFPERLTIDLGSVSNTRSQLVDRELPGKNSYSLFDSNLHSL